MPEVGAVVSWADLARVLPAAILFVAGAAGAALLLFRGGSRSAVESVGLARKVARLDPGRSDLNFEWFGSPGRSLLKLPLEGGGMLEVTAHDASQLEGLPKNTQPNSRQEWRVLRFEPAEGTTNLVQSVTKVCIPPIGAADSQVRLRGDCLPLTYTKSFVSVVCATLSAMGLPVLDAHGESEPVRILCIGLGGGSVPSFFAEMLPRCSVDVVELEAAVLRAATEELGFYVRPGLHAALGDGAAFAERAASQAADDPLGGAYDAVLVDAYDAAGNVPEPLRCSDGGLARALSGGLLRSRGGLVATNILPAVDPAPILAAYHGALASRGAGPGFTIQAPNNGNRIVVQTATRTGRALPTGEALLVKLKAAGLKVQEAIACPFNLAMLAAHGFTEWPK